MGALSFLPSSHHLQAFHICCFYSFTSICFTATASHCVTLVPLTTEALQRLTVQSHFARHYFSFLQFTSVAQPCPTICDPMDCSRPPCPSTTPRVYSNSCPLSRWCHPTISSSIIPFSSCLQSFPASRSFPNELVLQIRWPRYWSFSFNISPSNEYSGLISFRMDWLDPLAVQGTLKSLVQHHSSKASILRRSAFFIVQLSQPYMTTGKTIALTRWTFVGEVMSLLFNMLSKLVIAFLSRSKHLLISWLQSPSAVILEPTKIKSVTVSTVSPSICHEAMGPEAIAYFNTILVALFVIILSWSGYIHSQIY